MYIDARKLDNNTIIEGDICIIGAGTAGISIALDWIDTPYKVILLEGGGFEYDDRIQELNSGKTTGQKYYPLKSSRLRSFGGTTGSWQGLCSPFDKIDFMKRDWVPNSGWPIKRKDLNPFYIRAAEKLNLKTSNFDFDYWRNEHENLNPLPFDKKVIWNKMWQHSSARFGNLYKETIINAKNVHLFTYANAVEIKANENVSKISEIIVKNFAGKTHKVKAKQFILACGAIQNSRLLLTSNSQVSNGLGNDNDIVGRYFMGHIEIPSAHLWLPKPFHTDLYKWHRKNNIHAELAITENAQIKHRILNGTVALSGRNAELQQKPPVTMEKDLQKTNENMFLDWAGVSKEKAAVNRVTKFVLNKNNVYSVFLLNTRIEQAPNPNSRITIGPEKDEFGVQRANLHWELTALDKRSIRKIFDLIIQQAGISGFGRIQLMEFLRDRNDDYFPDSQFGGWHHMGTTRMNDDPKKGVVDANCQLHGIQNLHIAGSACFPTSGAPNPTLTLVALSLRLSDHVKNKLSD